jgi:segregation and condensation protein B
MQWERQLARQDSLVSLRDTLRNMETTLAHRIEALLFSEGGPLTKKKLCAQLGCSVEELEAGLVELKLRYQGGGLSLIVSDTEAALAVAEAALETVKKAQEAELGNQIGDAGLEVISILLYKGPSTRAQIDYIRGVNTSSTIRNLLSRGLVERAGNPLDAREYLYRPTTELLAHLGVTEKQELPDYGKISSELASFERSVQAEGPFASHDGTRDTAADSASGQSA